MAGRAVRGAFVDSLIDVVLVAIAGWDDVDQRRAGQLASLDKSTVAEVVRRLVGKGGCGGPRIRPTGAAACSPSPTDHVSDWPR